LNGGTGGRKVPSEIEVPSAKTLSWGVSGGGRKSQVARSEKKEKRSRGKLP